MLGDASPLPEESVCRTEATLDAEALLTFFRASVDILGLWAVLGGLGWAGMTVVVSLFYMNDNVQCSSGLPIYTHQIYTVTETELAVT